MKIETLELAGMASALEALRLPYGKGKRSLTYATRRGSEVQVLRGYYGHLWRGFCRLHDK